MLLFKSTLSLNLWNTNTSRIKRVRVSIRYQHDTYNYTELCHFYKLLSVSPCQYLCRVSCPCRYPCFIGFNYLIHTRLWKVYRHTFVFPQHTGPLLKSVPVIFLPLWDFQNRYICEKCFGIIFQLIFQVIQTSILFLKKVYR
jgi:hypothetical protein